MAEMFRIVGTIVRHARISRLERLTPHNFRRQALLGSVGWLVANHMENARFESHTYPFEIHMFA